MAYQLRDVPVDQHPDHAGVSIPQSVGQVGVQYAGFVVDFGGERLSPNFGEQRANVAENVIVAFPEVGSHVHAILADSRKDFAGDSILKLSGLRFVGAHDQLVEAAHRR